MGFILPARRGELGSRDRLYAQVLQTYVKILQRVRTPQIIIILNIGCLEHHGHRRRGKAKYTRILLSMRKSQRP